MCFATRCLPLFSFVVMLAACECRQDGQDDPASAERRTAPRRAGESGHEMPGPVRMSAPGAFDLVATSRGALLAWGGEGGGLRVLALGPDGSTRGAVRQVGDGRADASWGFVRELAAAANAGRVGLAWRERYGGAVRVRATRGNDTGGAFAPPTELGPSVKRQGSRGGVAMAASLRGELDVLYRGRWGPCRSGAGAGRCVRFRHYRLGGSEGASGRRAVPLVVPDPCARAVVGNVFSNERWYFALCALKGGARSPRTTVYGVQFAPPYAHAEEVLPGCVPSGMAPADDGTLLTGDCGDRIHAVMLSRAGRRLVALGPANRAVRCAQGLPIVRVEGRDRAVRLRLDSARSRLETLLPPYLAPAGARAVWSGRALLVAEPDAAHLTLRRYRCRGGRIAAF